MSAIVADEKSAAANKIVVALSSQPGAARVAKFGCELAAALRCEWEAVHVETPFAAGASEEPAADALSLAASLGATVSKIPAAGVASGLAAHVRAAGAGHLIIGNNQQRFELLHPHRVVREFTRLCPEVIVHLVATERARAADQKTPTRHPMSDYAYALLSVGVTALLAFALHRQAGMNYLSFLFFFPVIGSAAKLGTKPAIVAAIACSLVFNYLFLSPAFVLKPSAAQSWVMSAALICVGLYTGAMTATVKARAALSERSAQENASIATFVAELTRAADWDATAEVVCSHVAALLNVQTILVRDVGCSLTVIASVPSGLSLEPLDRAALEWAWSNGTAAGSGSSMLSASNWHFQPLTTSLGTLAVLALAQPDGRDPVPATRKLLLATLVAQSSLALERLHFEDKIRGVA